MKNNSFIYFTLILRRHVDLTRSDSRALRQGKFGEVNQAVSFFDDCKLSILPVNYQKEGNLCVSILFVACRVWEIRTKRRGARLRLVNKRDKARFDSIFIIPITLQFGFEHGLLNSDSVYRS